MKKVDKVRASGREFTGVSNQMRVLCVIFVVRDGVIRIFNVWRAKQTALKKYYAEETNDEAAAARNQANTDPNGDKPAGKLP